MCEKGAKNEFIFAKADLEVDYFQPQLNDDDMRFIDSQKLTNNLNPDVQLHSRSIWTDHVQLASRAHYSNGIEKKLSNWDCGDSPKYSRPLHKYTRYSKLEKNQENQRQGDLKYVKIMNNMKTDEIFQNFRTNYLFHYKEIPISSDDESKDPKKIVEPSTSGGLPSPQYRGFGYQIPGRSDNLPRRYSVKNALSFYNFKQI